MNIRKLPRHAIVSRLKNAKVTQREIGRRAGVTQCYVSLVLARRATVRPNETTERVWREIERVLIAFEKVG